MQGGICSVASAVLSVLACSVLVCASGEASSSGPKKSSQPPADFFNDVFPLLETCSSASCHGGAAGAGDLKLSLFGGDKYGDFSVLKYYSSGRLLKPWDPDDSLLLKKTSGKLSHGGGVFFKGGSPKYELLKRWIAEGAPYATKGRASAEKLILEVVPELSVERAKESEGFFNAREGESFSVKTSAKFSDGSVRRVDANVSIEGKSVEKLKDGKFLAKSPGQSVLRFSRARKFATVVVDVSPNGLSEFSPGGGSIDSCVDSKIETLGLKKAPLCSDSEFLRRVYLDATGLLPPPEVAEKFLESKNADKRARLVDKLLGSEEFSDFLAMRFGDLLRIKSEFPSNLWPNAVQAYNAWLRRAVGGGMPYNIFARELLDTTGTNFRSPQVNFFRAVSEKSPMNYADAAALVFMGARMNCIKCHAHPFEEWTSEDALSMAAFFAQVKFKGSKEWKEEILYLDESSVLKNPETGKAVEPRTLDGFSPESFDDPRSSFANWLTSPENPWFARAAVNRIWAWVFGRGIIEPADDIRPNNPPSNAELLEYLESEFKKDFDVRRIFRLIFTSEAYARKCSPPLDEKRADEEVKFLSRRVPSRLCAESLYDVLNISLGLPSDFKSIVPEPYSFWPKDFRAINLSDGSVGNAFLSLFGKPARNSSYLNDRSNAVTMPQVMRLANFSSSKFSDSPVLRKLAKKKIPDREKIKKLYLTFLSRRPSSSELDRIEAFMKEGGSVFDVAWVLSNTKEFIFKM